MLKTRSRDKYKYIACNEKIQRKSTTIVSSIKIHQVVGEISINNYKVNKEVTRDIIKR